MKVNKKLMFNAIAGTCFSLYSVNEIAKAVVNSINVGKDGATEVNTTRANGFVLRCRKDASLTDSYLYDKITEATEELLADRADETADYMSDTYDLVYDSKYVTGDYAREMFEISRNGRLIYIEVDIG